MCFDHICDDPALRTRWTERAKKQEQGHSANRKINLLAALGRNQTSNACYSKAMSLVCEEASVQIKAILEARD